MTLPADHKVVLVPEGLAGERVDAAMARMFGVSRTRAAELIGEGHVHLDGAVVAKSDRVAAGAMLDVVIPTLRRPARPSSRRSSRGSRSSTTTTRSW